MGRKQSEYRKKEREFSPSSYDEGGFAFADLGKDIERQLKSPLSKKDRKKVEKLQAERKEREEKERQERQKRQKETSSFGGSNKGGKPMYQNQRRRNPMIDRSMAVQSAAKRLVEVEKEKGKDSEEYRKAESEFDRFLGVQKSHSPKQDPLRETRNTVFFLQRAVIRGEDSPATMFTVAGEVGLKYLGYVAIAVRDARQELLGENVNLRDAEITDRADPQNVEKVLLLLDSKGLKRAYGDLARAIPHKWLQRTEVRRARIAILAKKPEFEGELSLEVTGENVGKLLGGLRVVGDEDGYSSLARSVPENWRRPIFPKKVEQPSEKKAAEKKQAPKKEPTIEAIKGLTPKQREALKDAGYSDLGAVKKAGWDKVAEVKGVGPKAIAVLEAELKLK